MELYPVTPICEGCGQTIEFGPYLAKVWATTGNVEYFHPRCYVLTHPGILENTDPLPAGLKVTSLGLLARTLLGDPFWIKTLNEKVEYVIGYEPGTFMLDDNRQLVYQTPTAIVPMYPGVSVRLR